MKIFTARPRTSRDGISAWLCLAALIAFSVCAAVTSNVNRAGMFSTFAVIALAGAFFFGLRESKQR